MTNSALTVNGAAAGAIPLPVSMAANLPQPRAALSSDGTHSLDSACDTMWTIIKACEVETSCPHHECGIHRFDRDCLCERDFPSSWISCHNCWDRVTYNQKRQLGVSSGSVDDVSLFLIQNLCTPRISVAAAGEESDAKTSDDKAQAKEDSEDQEPDSKESDDDKADEESDEKKADEKESDEKKPDEKDSDEKKPDEKDSDDKADEKDSAEKKTDDKKPDEKDSDEKEQEEESDKDVDGDKESPEDDEIVEDISGEIGAKTPQSWWPFAWSGQNPDSVDSSLDEPDKMDKVLLDIPLDESATLSAPAPAASTSGAPNNATGQEDEEDENAANGLVASVSLMVMGLMVAWTM